jgi:hypothetical protein
MANIRIEKDLDPTFTRASTAFKNDGSSVASGVVRYENVVDPINVSTPAQWDRGTYQRGVGASYNLLTLNQSNAETDITGVIGSGGGVSERSNEWSWQGSWSWKCTNTLSTAQYVTAQIPGYVLERRYLASMYAYNPNSEPIVVGLTLVMSASTSRTFTIPASGLVRIHVIRNASATSVANSSAIRFYTSSGLPFFVDGLMLEDVTDRPNQVVPSPWVPGGDYLLAPIDAPDFTRISDAFNLGVSVGVNTPRFVSGGLLFERSVTNLTAYSQEFDNAYWTKSGASASTGVIAAPDGTLTAEKITEDSSTDVHYVTRNHSLTINTAYSNSVYAKAGERNWLRISTGTAANNSYVNFDLSNGVVGNTNNSINSSIESVGNGWYRCSYSFIASSTATGGQRFHVMDSDSAAAVSSGPSYTGDGTSGLYLWGAQLELSDCVTSYIPTAADAVTRNADFLRIPNYGLINKTSGAAIVRTYVGPVKAAFFAGGGNSTRTLMQIHGDPITTSAPSSNVINVDYNASSATALRVNLINNSGTTTNSTGTAIATPGWYNIGIRWESEQLQLWFNGAQIGADVSMSPFNEFTAMTLGSRGNLSTGSVGWNDTISHANLYDSAPSTGEMASLTAAGVIPTGGVYQLDFSNDTIEYSSSGIYVSEWFNTGIVDGSYTASGVVSTPSGTSVQREYRQANLTDYSDASAWSLTPGLGKYIQYRETLVHEKNSAQNTNPYVTSTSLIPANYGKSIMIEGSATNLLTSPLAPATQTVAVTPDADYALRFDGTALSSGSVLIEHVGVETTTADFSTGTLVNTQASGDVLTLATPKADPTFTRATVATLPNELTEVGSGVVRYASGAIDDGVTNLVLRSQEINNSWWVKSACAVTADLEIAPDGTRTADLVVPNGTNGSHSIIRNSSLMTLGTPYSFSGYFKPAGYNYVVLAQYDGSSSVGLTGFDLTNGTVTWNATNGGNSSGYIQAVGNGWYRANAVFIAPTMGRLRIYVADSAISSNSIGTFAGDGVSGLYMWGIQLEAGLNQASTYIPTTSAAAARSSLIGDRAIMIEEGTQNVLQRSQDFDNAYWALSAATISSGFVAPDGTSTAYKLFENASSARHYIYTSATVIASGIVTCSVYAKAAEVSGIQIALATGSTTNNAVFDLVSGVVFATGTILNSSIESANDGWYRCSVTIDLASANRLAIRTISPSIHGSNASYVGDPASGVLIWGAQAEYKNYPTSYVPTVASAVTRNNENVVLPNSAVNVSSGTILTRVYLSGDSAAAVPNNSAGIFDYAVGGTTNRFMMQRLASITNNLRLFIYDNSSNNLSQTIVYPFTTGWYTFGATWNQSSLSVSINGVIVGSYNLSMPSVSPSNFYLGRTAGGSYLNGLISDFVVYNEKFSDSELIYYTQTGAVIPLDHRTTYSLRFQDDLNHGEGGYRITPVEDLTQVGTITGSSVIWNSVAASGSVEIDSSIDNGSTWYHLSQSGAIFGLSSEVPASGKNLLIRQKLTTPVSATAPQLTDITTAITQKQTKNKNEYIEPLYSSLRFTPTNVSKWQLEARKWSTTIQGDETARASENFTIPSSGILNVASGSVIIRAYLDPEILNITTGKSGYLFWCGTDSALQNAIALWYQSGTFRAGYYSGSTIQASTTSASTTVPGYHTYGMTWDNKTVSLWVDGVKRDTDTWASMPLALGTTIRIGRGGTTHYWDNKIDQVDIFGEALTDSEMEIYTAVSGAAIPITRKHTYQLKFEDNLDYGMTGIYTSRALDSQVPNAKWATYKKQDVVPANASITYMFSASNDAAGPFEDYTTDITSITGRYIKVKIICMSSDVNNFNPQVLDNTVRVYPKSV